MLRLKKEDADKIFTEICLQIFQKNNNDYPDRFQDMGKEIADRLYEKFEEIERDPIVFKNTLELSRLPLEVKRTVKLHY